VSELGPTPLGTDGGGDGDGDDDDDLDDEEELSFRSREEEDGEGSERRGEEELEEVRSPGRRSREGASRLSSQIRPGALPRRLIFNVAKGNEKGFSKRVLDRTRRASLAREGRSARRKLPRSSTQGRGSKRREPQPQPRRRLRRRQW